jgi:hypothetical protein
MNTPQPPSIPPETLEELVRTMEAARDDLLKVSLLLRDHLEETDIVSREQARQTLDALIRKCKRD